MRDALARVRMLVHAARRLVDRADALGQRARSDLVESTQLSAEGIELALTHALEADPTDSELDALCRSVEPAPAVHVILPANVFVAAHRAIALALAASPNVFVRPSRREPHFARLLAEAAPGLFERVKALAPSPGDHVWAYGGDATLEAIRASLPSGVTLHAQGPGFGVAVIDARDISTETATALATDIAAFEQRGCLSPLTALVLGDAAATHHFAELLAEALANLALRIPPGRLDAHERADVTRFCDTARYAGRLIAAGPGFVFVSDEPRPTLAPPGRNLHVSPAPHPTTALLALGPERITAVGVSRERLATELANVLPQARISELGRMQRPALDGPADRRSATRSRE